MKISFPLLLVCLFSACQSHSQETSTKTDYTEEIKLYKNKFLRYIMKSGEVNDYISIDQNGITTYASYENKKAGIKEYNVPWSELDNYKNWLHYQPNEARQFYEDSSSIAAVSVKPIVKPKFEYKDSVDLPLKGLKIALDPGHIAGNMETAKLEGKYVEMSSVEGQRIAIFESELNWFTARILADKLEKLGAEVMLSRDDYGLTAFGMTYLQWYNAWDSVPKPSKSRAFWRYFRHKDNDEKVRKINAFDPDLTLTLHYNVDSHNEKYRWRRPTHRNNSMAFVGGGIMKGELGNKERRFHLLRLLLTDDIETSVEFSKGILERLQTECGIPIMPFETDQTYLEFNSINTSAMGVYARNLSLSSRVNGTLCFAEPLYQDNRKEVVRLNNRDYNYKGRMISSRLAEIADAYFKGIIDYLKK